MTHNSSELKVNGQQSRLLPEALGLIQAVDFKFTNTKD